MDWWFDSGRFESALVLEDDGGVREVGAVEGGLDRRVAVTKRRRDALHKRGSDATCDDEHDVGGSRVPTGADELAP